MPTLRPQKLSGLVVIPTVELSGGLWHVSIAINTGPSRVGGAPPDVVSREDLVVDLRAPSDGSLEPIASPDPGPLPVRALRVVQARGEFTFGQGFNAANELRVALRNDQKIFQMSQTFAPTSCLGGEPKEGGRFAIGPASISIPRGGLISRFPVLGPLLGPRCCVRHFDAPLNVSTDPAVKSESFEMHADFLSRGRKCRCSCCEYRQYVRGTFTDAGGAAVRFDMPSGALDPVKWCEDGTIDEFATGTHGYYGHRGTSTPGDEYSGTAPHAGCSYRANEKPSCPPAESAHLEFIGLVVDRCRRVVTAKRTWVVDL